MAVAEWELPGAGPGPQTAAEGLAAGAIDGPAGRSLPQVRTGRSGRARQHWVIATTWLSTVLLVAGAWSVALMLTWRDQQDALARAQRDSGNLARIIAEQTTRAIAGTDRILSFLSYDLHRFGLNNPDMRDVLRNATQGSDILVQLSYADAAGDVVQTSAEGGPGKINLADREHFLVHKEGKVQGLFISRPVLGRVSKKWSIQLSRRIDGPEGSFGGMIVASIDPFYFGRTFNELDVGEHGVISIFGQDGILRARTDMNDQIIGQDLSRSPVFAAALQQEAGFVRAPSAIDGVTRLTSFRHLANYPLTVTAGFAEDEFFTETHRRRSVSLVVAGLVSLLLAGTATLVTRSTATGRRCCARRGS